MIPDDQYNMFLTIWGHFGPNLAYKKILGKFTKVLGFGKTPPQVGKNFQIISFFLFDSVPKTCQLKLANVTLRFRRQFWAPKTTAESTLSQKHVWNGEGCNADLCDGGQVSV